MKNEEREDKRSIPMTSFRSGKGEEVTADVYYYTNQIVNIIMIGKPEMGKWVLVDAGMPNSAKEIIKVAEKRFGENTRPEAILLTHGHFDHTGSLVELLEHWDVPVYAHEYELLYLTGDKRYPEPDTGVEGGMLAKLSSLYPIEPVNISNNLKQLPPSGMVPNLPDWKWIHVPGHAPGQVAFFRENDGVLIAGDAFVTVKQDSLYKVLVQKKQVCGPPVYLTTNWKMAEESLEKLVKLKPIKAITGHGPMMEGEELERGLAHLIRNFKEKAVPDYGKFTGTKRDTMDKK